MNVRPHRRRTIVVVVAVGVALTGCTTVEPDAATTTRTIVSTLPPPTTLTITTGGPTPSSAPTTPASTTPASTTSPLSRTADGSTTPVAAPTTALPAPIGGDCPYFTAEAAAELTGQRTGPGELIATSPAPICVFTRSDGGWLAAVRVFRTPDAASAAAAVDERIPVADSSPADDPAGWTGGYLGLPSGAKEYPDARSVYGVSKGSSAVVAWTNQAQSIKSRRIVEAVIGNLQL
ncbi:MAG: DUF2020 domain-containing protein [Nakamurella sp.]